MATSARTETSRPGARAGRADRRRGRGRQDRRIVEGTQCAERACWRCCRERIYASDRTDGTSSIYGQGLMDLGAAVLPVRGVRLTQSSPVDPGRHSVHGTRLGLGPAFGERSPEPPLRPARAGPRGGGGPHGLLPGTAPARAPRRESDGAMLAWRPPGRPFGVRTGWFRETGSVLGSTASGAFGSHRDRHRRPASPLARGARRPPDHRGPSAGADEHRRRTGHSSAAPAIRVMAGWRAES